MHESTLPWSMFAGSCMEGTNAITTLPENAVHHIITDPPYEAEPHERAMRSKRGGGVERHHLGFEPMTDALRRDFACEAVRICRGWILVFCQVEAIGAWREALVAGGAQWRRAMIWVKPDAAPQFRGDRPSQAFEAIACAWAGRGRSRWNARGRRGIYVANCRDGKTRPHPTAKPILLMEALINDFTQRGQIIADPFAGAGATGVAAVEQGRQFVGWELDPLYYSRAVKRLRSSREQLELFGCRIPGIGRRPKQLRLAATTAVRI